MDVREVWQSKKKRRRRRTVQERGGRPRERDNARSPLALQSLCSFSLTVYVVWGTGLPRHPLSYSHSTEPFLQPLFFVPVSLIRYERKDFTE